MKLAEKKVIQAIPVFLNISILALLFFLTVAPSIIDNTRASSLHQENLREKNGVAPTTNELGFSHHLNVDKVVPSTNELDQASRNILEESAIAPIPNETKDPLHAKKGSAKNNKIMKLDEPNPSPFRAPQYCLKVVNVTDIIETSGTNSSTTWTGRDGKQHNQRIGLFSRIISKTLMRLTSSSCP